MANMYNNNQYLEQAVTTMTKGELVVFTCDIALVNINKALAALEKRNLQDVNNFIIKAQDAVHYLMETLNMELSISKELYPIYDFISKQLVQANVKKDAALLTETHQMMSDLKVTWKQAEKQYHSSK